jgi:general secretion pathway protein F
MPVFEYKALDGRGRRLSGIVTADGPASARLKLTQESAFPVEIKEVGEIVRGSRSEARFRRFSLHRRLDPAEVSAAIRQMATLVSSGLPLIDCLNALIEQTEQVPLKRIFTQLREKVVEGEALSSAMADHPGAFNAVFVNMVRAAESGGALDVVLKRLADFSERGLKLKKRIAAAMTYPIFMLMVSGIILVFLMSFVMPKMVGIFEGMELALPWATRFLIWVTEALKAYWWLTGISLAVIIGGAVTWIRSEKGGRIWDKFRLRMPLFGKLHKKAVIARFTRTLAILLRSGLPLVQALETSRLSSGNRIIEEAVQKASQRIGEGADFAGTLKSSGEFPPLVVQLVRAGEQSGELEEMLEKAAELYEDDVESTISSLTSVIEPTIILIMGMVVAFIVTAILLPIFEMSGVAR